MVGNLTAWGLKFATKKQYDLDASSLVIDTGVGALTGLIPGRPKIRGVNAGRGSDLQVFRQIVRKFRNGMIWNVKPETVVRMAKGAYCEYAAGQGAAAGAAGSTVYTKIVQ
jgi:hypothetical protein